MNSSDRTDALFSDRRTRNFIPWNLFVRTESAKRAQKTEAEGTARLNVNTTKDAEEDLCPIQRTR